MNHDWVPPEYLSPSQISTLLTCGEQYRLTRVEHAPERPMWAGIGGSAVHRATEHRDREAYAGEPLTPAREAFDLYWQEAADEALERHPEFAPEDYYTSGRASKAWPNKENADWWKHNGPQFVEQWTMWLDATGYLFWEFPDEEGTLQPGIEVEVWAYGDGGEQVRSIIDRVLVDPNGEAIRLVDLKTGSTTPAFPMQMALNNLGMISTFEEPAQYAGFWSARKGGVMEWTPLERFTEDWLWDQVSKAYKMRDQQLFIPQPGNLCKSACGVRQWCVAMGGTPFTKD